MLNPEKILGGLLRGSTRSRGMFGKLGVGTIGLGLLGVAMEAATHYMGNSGTQQRSGGLNPSTPHGAPSGPVSPQGGPPLPPPIPGTPAAGLPPPPPATEIRSTEGSREAVLLIRAMIVASNADGAIDEEERGRILERLQGVALTPEEHAFIVHELLSPCDLDGIVNEIKSQETAKQVYTVSLMAIEVDTDAKRQYIKALAQRLCLDDALLEEIHRDLGIERP